MMAEQALRSEERVGLVVALAAHAALVVLLVRQVPPPAIAPIPERIEVTISSEVGLTSTSPEPASNAASDVAPTLGEPAPPAEAEAAPLEPAPEPAPEPPPRPAPRTVPEPPAPPRPAPSPKPRVTPSPKPRVTPSPKPVPRATPSPRPSPSPRETARPAPRPSPKASTADRASPSAKDSPRPKSAAKSSTAKAPAAKSATPATKTGGSRIGDDFLEGVQGARSTGASKNPPAAAIGPAVRSSLASAVSRQLKPHWAAPQGADAEQLITILAWDLAEDGSLKGRPRLVRQEGITDANRAQADRHAEQAIRAVQLAAPFNLPSEYYDGWKRVASFRFDRRLSQ